MFLDGLAVCGVMRLDEAEGAEALGADGCGLTLWGASVEREEGEVEVRGVSCCVDRGRFQLLLSLERGDESFASGPLRAGAAVEAELSGAAVLVERGRFQKLSVRLVV